MHLSATALDALEAQPWPGNIRELANLIERLVLLVDGTAVSAQDLLRFLPRPAPLAAPAPAVPMMAAAALPEDPTAWPLPLPLVREYRELRSHTAQELRQALAQHGGNQSRAAQSLGLTPRQFGYRWRRLVAAA